jgi:serine/threonine protein kinase
MGVVYRAVDTKLGREVAVKILPPELVADESRRRRIVKEAKAAAIHHPHIATIHEIDRPRASTSS